MTAVVMESYQALLMGVMRVGTLRLLGRGETRTGGNSRPAGPEQRKQARPSSRASDKPRITGWPAPRASQSCRSSSRLATSPARASRWLAAPPAVPCGAYSGQVLKKARVTVQPVSEETSVSSVVTKVSLGEADAGIAYTTDVKAGGSKIAGVPIPASQNVTADDPVVQLKDAPNSAPAALARGTRWPGCWRAGSSAARPCCAAWPRCRWCCRPSSGASPCCSPTAARG